MHAGKGVADAGVSPVVGMILVLAISVVGIAAVLYWGGPAVDEMKANVEFKAVQTQFQELDSDFRELVAGTAGKTAKRFQPSFSRGQFIVEKDTERWAIGVDYRSRVGTPSVYNFTLGDHGDGDNDFSLAHQGVGDFGNTVVVRAYVLDNAAEILTNVSTSSSSYAQMTSTTWTAGTVKNFWITKRNVAQSVANQPMTGKAFRIEVWNGADLAAQWWVYDAGRVHFNLDAGQVSRDYYASNGALVQCSDGFCRVDNVPGIPPGKFSGTTYRTFARMLSVNGTASFGGESRFDLILDLYSTVTLLSGPDVRALKMNIKGVLSKAWDNYFEENLSTFAMTKVTTVVGTSESYWLKTHPSYTAATCAMASSINCMTTTLVLSVVIAGRG
ncbi:MAG TPA: hypothetical protein VM889_03305 [Candidatus Thermoplasmatota archaeon]|nr:hypothetical protein [Candidatus Thermoplasmatota archaeon]